MKFLGRIFLTVSLALAVACMPGNGKEDDKADKEKDDKDAPLRSADVLGGDFQVTVSANGKVVANREVDILSRAGGQIIELPFQAGDKVKEGDLLVKLDPVDEQRNVDKATAALESAKAKLARAKNDLELTRSSSKKSTTDAESAVQYARTKLADAEAKAKRQEELWNKKLVPEETVETAKTAFEQARSELIRAESALEDVKSLPFQIAAKEQDVKLAAVEVGNVEISLADAQRRLSYTTIHSPMDGTLTERKPEVGMVISSPLGNVGGGTKLMVVSDLSSLYLVTSVDETDIGGITLGQKALITSDAYPTEDFEGVVSQIAPAGIALNNVVTFDVRVKVEGAGIAKLKPGMTANVTIVLAESHDTLWTQSEAVQEENGQAFVEVEQKDKEPRRVNVETKLTDGLMTEIKGDLKAGDKLVIREKDGLTAWERGEGGERPMRGGFNPFKRRTSPKSGDKK